MIGRAFEELEELHDQGKIPNTTIPVLQDRLSAEICICGETLDPGDPDGGKRRAHIQKLIDDSQRADEVQEIITDLYYGAKPLQSEADAGSSIWLEEYKKVVERRDGIQALRDRARAGSSGRWNCNSIPFPIQIFRVSAKRDASTRTSVTVHLSKQSDSGNSACGAAARARRAGSQA